MFDSGKEMLVSKKQNLSHIQCFKNEHQGIILLAVLGHVKQIMDMDGQDG